MKQQEQLFSHPAGDTAAMQPTTTANMAPNTFKEILFYLLTLNCTSFMLCKPPFSLSSLLSSTVKRMSAAAASPPATPFPDPAICFHPRLFMAPYSYLYANSDGGWWTPKYTALNILCDCRRQNLSGLIEVEGVPLHRGSQNGGFTDLLKQKETSLIERTRGDLTTRKKKGREKGSEPPSHHRQRPDSVESDKLRRLKALERRELATSMRSKEWTIKKRYEAEKIAVQKAREEIVRKKYAYESEKITESQIKLLGRKFLEKSLQQGMQIQHQLSELDQALKSMQKPQSPPSTPHSNSKVDGNHEMES